jgi:LmbE family N-acetylglucosaminyl deacetylase
MKPMTHTRREMLAASGGLVGASLLSMPVFSRGNKTGQRPLKILVAGAHPDDPESGCGGTICKMAYLGHQVTVLYLTRGEAGIPGTSHQEAARIRTAEAEEACRVMHARPRFAGQIDGSTVINREAYQEVASIVEEEAPDVVFTHWPIDTHRDHRICSNLLYDAWNSFRWDDQKAFDLYYYEVLTGEQSQHFHPTHFNDISDFAAQKKEATLKHVSQKADEWFSYHEKMDEFRGFQYPMQCRFAESFIRQGYSPVLS